MAKNVNSRLLTVEGWLPIRKKTKTKIKPLKVHFSDKLMAKGDQRQPNYVTVVLLFNHLLSRITLVFILIAILEKNQLEQ